MCGLCGIAYRDPHRSVEPGLLESMMDTLTHRGPDDSGAHIDGNVGLGHRRLSIVDVEGGHQPLPNEDESAWVTCNGEIYNHPSLMGELEARRHRYRTRSDSETIVHAYEEWGKGSLPRLRGMFAFALWDVRSRTLLLARDRIGIKPMYYAVSDDGDLVWGSEIKAILASGLVKPALKLDALPEYLANRYTTGDHTLFREVRRLRPGHVLIWRGGEVRQECYWDLADVLEESRNGGAGLDALAEDFEAALDDAISSHLMSDVPLGVFLSGGLDSSAIAALMHEQVGHQLRSYSVGYDDADASELPYAQIVADYLGNDHTPVVVTADDFFEALPRLVWHEDEPIAHPSSIPLYFLAARAAEDVKVVLTGEGSDEILAGYGKYWRTLLNFRLGRAYERVPAFFRDLVRGGVDRLPETSFVGRKLQRTFLARPADPEGLFFDNFGVYSADRLGRLLSPEIQDALRGSAGLYGAQHGLWAESEGGTPLTRLLYLDVKSYLHELLMKQDQMSMAASLESRVPFLDHHLIELAFRMPDHGKLKGRATKRVLRRIMERKLPPEILSRPKKGFPTPLGRWLATSHWEKVEELALDPDRLTAHLFDDHYVRAMAHEHRVGAVDHTERIWALLNLEVWARHYPALMELE